MDGVIPSAANLLRLDPANPDTILDALQYAFGGQIQESLLKNMEQGRILTERVRGLAGLPQQLAARRLEKPVAVDAGKLVDCIDSGAAPDALFASDGPNLGRDLEQAEQLLAQLQANRIELDVSVRYPVLRQIGTAPDVKSELLWLDREQRQALDRYQQGASPVPGSVLRLDDGDDEAVSWLCLDAWANLRTSNEALDAAAAQGQARLAACQDDLVRTSRQIDIALLALNQFLLQVADSGKDAGDSQRQAYQRRQQELENQTVERRRLEREEMARRQEERRTIDPISQETHKMNEKGGEHG